MLKHESTTNTKTLIEAAIWFFDNQERLARATGVSQGAVSKWLRGGGITIENALEIEYATNGFVTAAQLRPDIAAML